MNRSGTSSDSYSEHSDDEARKSKKTYNNDSSDNDLFEDEDDKERLMAIPEVEREQILYERAEKLREKKERDSTLQRAHARKTNDSDDDPSETEEKSHHEEKNTFSDTSSSSGEEEEINPRRDAATRKSKQLQKDEFEDSSDGEWNDDMDASVKDDKGFGFSVEEAEEKEKMPITFEERSALNLDSGLRIEDISMCRLLRENLEKWMNEPFFEKAVKGCFVKLGIGERKGIPVYRLCQIDSVSEYKRQYSMPGGKPTTKALILRFGASRKEFMMQSVSNHRVSINEFNVWRDQCTKDRIKMPTPAECKAKHLRTKKIVSSYQYTAADVAAMVKRNNDAGLGTTNTALVKIKLERAIGAAIQDLDRENIKLALARSEAGKASMSSRGVALRELDEAKSKRDTAASKLKTLEDKMKKIEMEEEEATEATLNTKDAKMKALNERNRRSNETTKKKKKRKRNGAEIEEYKEEVRQFDPFARRKCRPKIIWCVGKYPIQRTNEMERLMNEKKGISEKKSEPSVSQDSGSLSNQDTSIASQNASSPTIEKPMVSADEERVKISDSSQDSPVFEGMDEALSQETSLVDEVVSMEIENNKSIQLGDIPIVVEEPNVKMNRLPPYEIMERNHMFGNVDPIVQAMKLEAEEKAAAIIAKASAMDANSLSHVAEARASCGMTVLEYCDHAAKMRESHSAYINTLKSTSEEAMVPTEFGRWGGGIAGDDKKNKFNEIIMKRAAEKKELEAAQAQMMI